MYIRFASAIEIVFAKRMNRFIALDKYLLHLKYNLEDIFKLWTLLAITKDKIRIVKSFIEFSCDFYIAFLQGK